MELKHLQMFLRDLESVDPQASFHLNNIEFIAAKGTREDGTLSISALHKMIHYIERIRFEYKRGFFESPKTMATQLIQNNRLVLPLEDFQFTSPLLRYNKIRQMDIPEKSYQTFARIHDILLHEIEPNLRFVEETERQAKLKDPKKLAWVHSFKKTENQEIINDSIEEWQKSQMQPIEEQEQKKVGDFIRAWSIQGLVVKNEQELDELLTYLVQSANYPTEQEELLKHWIAVRGAQQVKAFTDIMINRGQITGHADVSSSDNLILHSNWTVEKGKLVFNFETAVFKLVFPAENQCRVNIADKLAIKEVDFKVNTNDSRPIFKLKTKIELEVKDDPEKEAIVIPKVKSLLVACNCRDIKKPEEIPQRQIKPS